MSRTALLLTLAALATPSLELAAQAGKTLRPKAKATADSTSVKSSATRRVVVVDGKTVVDESTTDGAKGADAELGRVVDEAVRRAGTDPAKLAEELERRVRGLVERRLPAGSGASTRSTHTRRVVVVNGETLVDEETRDGRPVGKGLRTVDPLDAVASRPGAARAEARAEARADATAEKSSSAATSTRRDASDRRETGSTVRRGRRTDGPTTTAGRDAADRSRPLRRDSSDRSRRSAEGRAKADRPEPTTTPAKTDAKAPRGARRGRIETRPTRRN